MSTIKTKEKNADTVYAVVFDLWEIGYMKNKTKTKQKGTKKE